MKANEDCVNYRLRDARLELGFSLCTLTKVVGLKSPTSLSSYETLGVCPYQKTALKIAAALRKPVSYLFSQYKESHQDPSNNNNNHPQDEKQRPSYVALTRTIVKHLAVVEDEPNELTALKKRINEALARLPYEERELLALRFGVGEETKEHTLEDIGLIFGFSRETSRNREARALKKLRKSGIKARLECFL